MRDWERGYLLWVSYIIIIICPSASHAHLVPDVPRPSSPLPLHLLPPSTEEDHYCCEVEVGEEKEGGVVKVMVGVCRVNGEVVMPRGEPVRITGGAFLDLGNSFQLQLVCR